MKIANSSTIHEVASIVCECLLKQGIQAVLSGGAVVSIYTHNEYESNDLDFVSSSDLKTIAAALATIGFTKTSGRHFSNPNTIYFVEFPSPPLAIGNMPIKEWVTQRNSAGRLLLLSPTHSVMDRLAGFYHWNDFQNLDQAVMIAKKHPIKLKDVEEWSKRENELNKFQIFCDRISENNQT